MRRRVWTQWVAGIALCLLPPRCAAECGITWKEPRSHFKGVDLQGHIHLVEKIGALELGGGRGALPIYLIFNSSYGASCHGGSVAVPLLDCCFVQIDDTQFLLKAPSGWLIPFRRTPNQSVLEGASGMKAEIRDDIVTVWSDCGDKLTFKRGRIHELITKKAKLSYSYSNDQVTEIREGGDTVLKVNLDAQNGRMESLVTGGDQMIRFEWGEQPMVQVINQKPILGGLRQTISKVHLANGQTKRFEFGVDARVYPALKREDGLLSVWHPETLIAETVGPWSYRVKPAKGYLSPSAISRTHLDGRSEAWHIDETGTQTIKTADQRVKVSKWFISGICAGKLRSEEIFDQDGKLIRSLKNSYNEKGKMLRKATTEGNVKIVHDYVWKEDGTCTISISGGKKEIRSVTNQAVDVVTLDDKGRLESKTTIYKKK